MAEDTTTTEAQPVQRLQPIRLDNAPTDTGRFAAFDTAFGRYVGGVHDSEAKARAAGKRAGAQAVTVHEV